MKVVLLIALEGDGRALPLARIEDRGLILQAALSVISSKRLQAKDMQLKGPLLGLVLSEEADRVERTLMALIPELQNFTPPPRTSC